MMTDIPSSIVVWFRRRGRVGLPLWVALMSCFAVVVAKYNDKPVSGYLVPGVVVGIGLWVTQFFEETDRKDQATAFQIWFGELPAVVGVASVALWQWASVTYFREIETGFYEVTAQIIPVLLLALIIDVRQSRHLESSALVLTLLVLVFGEVTALFFAAGAEGSLGYSIICGSLTSGFIAVIMAAVADFEVIAPKEEPTRTSSNSVELNAPTSQNLQENNTMATMRHGAVTTEAVQQIERKQREPSVAKFVLRRGADDKYYFNLVATNGQVIATSEAYESKASAISGIESVERATPTAEIEDQTDK